MTDDQYKSLAASFQQYPDSKVQTLRGEDIVRFGRICFAMGQQMGPEAADKIEKRDVNYWRKFK